MRHIDAFCHFFPQGLFEKMSQTTGGTQDIGKRMQGVRTIHDLDARLRMMDEFADYSEVLSLGLPPLEALAGPDQTPEFARVANDGLARAVREVSRSFRGLCRCAAHERARRRGEGSRAYPDPGQRERAPASYQRQWRLPGRAAVLSDLRNRGQGGQAGAAASRADAQCSGFPCREQIEIRDLGDPGLAL